MLCWAHSRPSIKSNLSFYRAVLFNIRARFFFYKSFQLYLFLAAAGLEETHRRGNHWKDGTWEPNGEHNTFLSHFCVFLSLPTYSLDHKKITLWWCYDVRCFPQLSLWTPEFLCYKESWSLSSLAIPNWNSNLTHLGSTSILLNHTFCGWYFGICMSQTSLGIPHV